MLISSISRRSDYGEIKTDMKALIIILIAIGSLVMITNITRYISFLRTTHDVLSSGSYRDRFRKYLALVLLIFFLIGYLCIATFSKPDMMMAMILFGGSIFVMILLTLIYGPFWRRQRREVSI